MKLAKNAEEIIFTRRDNRYAASAGDFSTKLPSANESLLMLHRNAGWLRDGPLYRLNDQDWEDAPSTNLSDVFYVMREVAITMARRGSAIVSIASVAGITGAPTGLHSD